MMLLVVAEVDMRMVQVVRARVGSEQVDLPLALSFGYMVGQVRTLATAEHCYHRPAGEGNPAGGDLGILQQDPGGDQDRVVC